MSRQDDHMEVRSAQILEAAMRVFARMGFHKARMDDIAQEAGVSKGLLYWYYKNKDAIIAAILDRVFSDELRHLRDALAAQGPVSARLIRLGEESARDILRMEMLIPIAFEFYALAGRNRHVRAALQRYYALYRQNLARLIEEGVTAGEFRPDIDPEGVAHSIIALIEGLILLWVVAPEQTALVDQTRQGLELVLKGIQARRIS